MQLRRQKSTGGDSGRFALEKTSDSFDKYDTQTYLPLIILRSVFAIYSIFFFQRPKKERWKRLKAILTCPVFKRLQRHSGRASDISREKNQNFAGFSGANSRKNRPISRDFSGKKSNFEGFSGANS